FSRDWSSDVCSSDLIKENKNAYEYRKINAEGVKKVYKNQSIASALKDEKWDYISLQQVSSLSGKYDTIMKSLPFMIHYVKKNKRSEERRVGKEKKCE